MLELEAGGQRRTDERPAFHFELTAGDQEDVRWYMEDYLQYPLDPAPAIARGIEDRMDQIGAELFRAVLEDSPIWAEVRHDRGETRVEIDTGVREATAIPWELLRDPESGVPLALQSRAFVRATHNPVQRARLPQTDGGMVRVLLVICRPRGADDVPFRSVARRLVEGLRGSDAVQLTVLRPPTFERLSAVLHDAKAEGRAVSPRAFRRSRRLVRERPAKGRARLPGVRKPGDGGQPRTGRRAEAGRPAGPRGRRSAGAECLPVRLRHAAAATGGGWCRRTSTRRRASSARWRRK